MLRGLIEQVLLTGRLLKDRRVPLWTKVVLFLPFVYLISPIDIIPDFLPVLGQLDDVSLILLGMRLFESLAPTDVVAEHRQSIANRGKRSFEVLENVEYEIRQDGSKAKRKRGAQ